MMYSTARHGYGADDPFDRAIEWLLIALLTFMPLAFGAVEAWSEEVVIVLAAAIAICFSARLAVRRDLQVVRTWAYAPVLAFLLLAAGQLLALPVSFVRLVSPNTVAEKMELLQDIRAAGPISNTMTISFYSHITAHDLRLVLAVAAVFVVVLNTFRRPEQVRRLLLVIAVIGAGVALVALMQDLFGNGMIYWFVSSPHGTALSGPFVNHSHYAQFMNLSIGAALALLCMEVHHVFGRRTITPALVADYLGSSAGRFVWVLSAIIVLGTATIFASLSRGGIVSLMMAGTFTALVLASRKSLRGPGWVIALLALGAFICVLYIGFDAVYDRLGTLSDLNRAEGGRWQIIRNVAVAWTRFPLLGTGLGTHEVVYPMFDRSTAVTLASHAENEYAQAAEETGALGLIALLMVGILVWWSYARTIRTGEAPVHSTAYGLGFGLLAVLIHSLSDFGQHVPANAFLSAIFCALLIRLPDLGRRNAIAAGEVGPNDPPAIRYGMILPIMVCLVSGWAVMRADQARRGEASWAKALIVDKTLTETAWQGSDEQYTSLLTDVLAAQQRQPGNVKYRYWLNVYRWRAISRVADPNTGEIVLLPQELEFVNRIIDDLKQTVLLCPTYGASWSVMGQLEKFICGQADEGARHIWRGRRLAPCDPTTCYVAGMLLAEQGDVDSACEEWKRAVELDGRLFGEVALQLVEEFDRPGVALDIAGDNVHRLSAIADILEASVEETEPAREVRGKLIALLEQKCRDSSAPAWALAWLARVYGRQGRIPDAILYYRRALSQDYAQVDWRYNLARLLSETGSVKEAIQEARTCLRIRPADPAVNRLIERLTHDTGMLEEVPQTP